MLESPLSPDLVTLIRESMKDRALAYEKHASTCPDMWFEYVTHEWECACETYVDDNDSFDILFFGHCDHAGKVPLWLFHHRDDILDDCLSELEDEFYIERASYCAFGED